MDLLPAVEELRRAILARFKNLKATEIPAYVALPEGFNAIQSGINTIGDNRDAAYFSTIEVDAWTRYCYSSAHTLKKLPGLVRLTTN